MLLLSRLLLRQIAPPSFLGLITWWLLITPGLALELRVAVQQNLSQVKVASSTPANILDSNGRQIANLQVLQGTAVLSGSGVSLGRMSGSRLWIEPTQGGLVQVGERWYRGRLELIGTGKGLAAVNHIDLEAYLPSVVGKEMYPTWPLESLKAQAVAARTYALYRRGRELRRGTSLFDLGDSVLFQAYPGVATETASTITAVQATQGQVLTYNGQLIEAVFHSASGGHTENSEQVWSGAVPYLRGVPDFDQTAPVYQWTIQLTATQLRQRIPGIGNILAFQPTQVSPQGRIMQVQVIGDAGTRTMTGPQIRSALGLRSTLFTTQPELPLVASQTNSRIPPSSFLISGRGSGHGLGMSQWGALGMANQGYTYDQILTYYYQGVTISQMRN
ncbi:SpoIID/LytB domain-containing protein [Synechococcus sp. PCC 6312]|uniref:SpoIID/LytB domain-containing protein n=1 Tax=Synechococcus sp. (strain ATCC 27167 / PCC 6312) TaxID=195253 RepID=UPI00029EDE56|nr:SpoIID/LytB domain-containing protein [Synechococcus sp. PCC 6312]AFY59831.1 SpoIID/LytB domain protein [Synechococcus sp. PCC 6312]